MTKWFLYLARCRDNTLYCGITNNPGQRVVRHNQGAGSNWVKQHGSAKIVYMEQCDNYLEARHRELQIKKWSRKKKENLIVGLKP